ncbi:hypothetical protein ACFYNM_23190 [Streptomyces spororaveus]|uniref:hypothetical protein n=1 Tax=Streptomyces spororaveus TaxID=284039 RepID=UPI0036C80CC7
MAMDAQQRTEFVNAYTKTLITAWSSDEYRARLKSDPRSALEESGLTLPADAEIVIVSADPETQPDGNLDVQVGLWEAGLASGRFEFHVPDAPVVETAELSESDLSGLSGGGKGGGPTVLTCCCPCSCCT